MSVEENKVFRDKYELLKGVERDKNVLDLLLRVDRLTEDYHQEKLDHARESQYNREAQRRENGLQDELRKYKNLVDRDAFILVLIDGDGMVFDDKLLSSGEAGGKEAARLLWNSVTDYVHRNIGNVPSDYKIVTRVYANLKGLGSVCQRSGMIDRSETIEDFARGFTGNKQLFDFVDVGMGKDRADDKISEIFKLYLYNCHCRHILFGCSHDNGYARLLEDVADSSKVNSITLLEGVPFERELYQLKSKYSTTRFDGLFRTSKINDYRQSQTDEPVRHRTSGIPPGPSDYRSPELNGLVLQSQFQPPSQPVAVARQTSASPANGNLTNPATSQWADAAKAAPPYVALAPPDSQLAVQASKQIQRNKYGQRIDPAVKCDPSELARIKKLKLCNVHYLRGDCPYGHCTHDHYYKPTKNELAILRHVSRGIPCWYGSDCDDPDCIHGHVCPNSVPGKKECAFGSTCRFEREQHGIDKTPEKTVKV